jgi:hypothetical protein
MKKIILFLMVQLMLFISSSYYIKEEISKHSIHPVYGNYEPKHIELGLQCQPWDSCRKTP